MKVSTAHNQPVKILPVMESFYTIQGEGCHSGKAAYFVRLGGCDVGCVWCDVKESWPAENHPQISVEHIMEEVSKSETPLVVVTGGEPLMYDLEYLTSEFHKNNLLCNIETSGAHPLSGNWDWICFSPKKFKEPLPEFYSEADELKIIIYNKSDFQWAESHAAKCSEKTILYLQPEWSKRNEMMPMIVEYVKNNPKWRISLQTHKYLDIP